MKKHRSPLRRVLLASLALSAFAGPAAASGCGAGFAPISQVSALRVLAVVADDDKSYAQPGDTVTFTMTYADPPGSTEAPEILWLGGCTDPSDDNYYGCYPQFAPVFAAFGSPNPHLPAGFSVGFGTTFSVTLPPDMISRRPKPTGGAPYEGSAFVFFAACVGGTIMPLPGLDAGVPASGGGLAGEFPLGCFDAQMNQLPAANFVPGYTEVFAFSDGRTNKNPVINGLSITRVNTDGSVPDAGTDASVPDGGTVDSCTVAEGVRLVPSSCGSPGPFTQCQRQGAEYQIMVQVPDDVAEVDPSTLSASGAPLHEIVWVDYFADQGDMDSPTLLVSDATTGIQKSYATNWIAPPAPESGTLAVNIWAVVHDSRGGEAEIQEVIEVPHLP